MELYNVLLFAHILAAVVLIGSSLIAPLMTRMTAHATSVSSLREWARFTLAVTRAGNPAALLLLVAGVWMTFLSWSWDEGWIVVSLVIFMVMGAMAGTVLEPHAKRLVAAADAAPEGPVTAELRDVVHDSKVHRVHQLFLPLDMAVLFMMTNKPGWVGAGTAVGLAVAAAAALILRHGMRRSASAVAA